MPFPLLLSSLMVPVLAVPQPAPGSPVRAQGATVVVLVRDIPGDPLASVRISLESKQQTLRGETSALGSVALADLPAGRYRLRAEKDGYRPHAQDLDLPGNGVREIQIRLVKTPTSSASTHS